MTLIQQTNEEFYDIVELIMINFYHYLQNLIEMSRQI
jgi:hypothetical protein